MPTALNRPTAARRRIYQALVDQPRRHWTIRALTDALAIHASVKQTAVHDTVNLLLILRLVEPIGCRHTLTISLTPTGERALTLALRRTHPQKAA